MVSSSKVMGDLNSINKSFTTYYDAIGNLNNSIWQGDSKNNLESKAMQFISQFKGKINSQISSFMSALDLYEEYKKLKKQKESAQVAYDLAVKNDSKDIDSYKRNLDVIVSKMDSLEKRIKSLLSTVTSITISGVESSQSSSSKSSATTNTAKKNNASKNNNDDYKNYYQYNYSNPYGFGETIKEAGCGTTSMAMVLTDILGEEITPVETSNWSLEHGYRVEAGTSWGYFDAISEEYGIDCQQMEVNKNAIINSLENGDQIIMSMKKGTFTSGAGHYIVLTGIDDNGKITVADPYSEKRSNQSFDINVFLNEGKQQWVFDA